MSTWGATAGHGASGGHPDTPIGVCPYMSAFLKAECPYMSVNVRHVRLKCPALNGPVVTVNYRQIYKFTGWRP